ncbi:MAG TPA: STAS domain-containing protein [Aggregatilineales bacterium]|nr:STAS domain-containing protein [Aggregatilineales bacterium]
MEHQINVIDPQRTVIHLTGRLDAQSAPSVRTLFADVVVGGHNLIVIDLAGVPFVDSSGLSALVSCLRAAREKQGRLVLAGVRTQAQIAIKQTRLDQVLVMHPDVTTALAALA